MWSQTAPPAQLLPPEQLDNLVAPIALYPDPLLGQVLAASTYPLEIVVAQQWLQLYNNLRGPQLMDAARQQNWDPSVQALVAFPDVMALLTRDVQWTTDLGNALLAQQADVMSAVQRMRGRAEQNGRLAATPQQTVTTETQNDQNAIAIQPADPQVVYVPSYNPAYVWGQPAAGAYPPLSYPPADNGWDFGPAVFIGSLFAGLLGWGGWGWGLSWLTHALFLNNLFFSHFGFHGLGGGFGSGYGATTVWAHNPVHRLGVPYANGIVASRYSSGRYNSGGYNTARYTPARYSTSGYNTNRYMSGFAGSRTAQYRNLAPQRSAPSTSYRSFSRAPNTASSYRSATPSYRSFAPAQHYSAPRSSSPRYSAPRASHYSAPHFSRSHSSGGHFSGGHSSHSSRGHSGGGSHRH